MTIDWKNYQAGIFHDELIDSSGQPRQSAKKLVDYLKSFSLKELHERQKAAELAIKTMGITFTVYSDGENIDREWPFDIIPRVIAEKEWKKTEQGLSQRLRALNCFIDDVYNDQKIFKDKVIPKELLEKSQNFRPQCVGMKPVY